ncbi:uncharacterized protein LOC128206875 [Mya arenaria]|uniref:uncharacterized protein LOC128206875 n=1 Tax=Mya arenaria TaxID=6604 RepID=UPI0022E1B7D7|nr:uncharacterized protein LOC128206875 [Mya arenaria]
MKLCWMVLHNISMTDGTVARLRSLDFTTTTQLYLTSPKEDRQLDALATLAGIINEAECDVINAAQSSVKQLLRRLQKGIKLSLRRYKGWSCRECAFTVRKLAQNDANVHLLVELGALELLVEMGRTGSEAELYESVQGIWALCFDKLVQQKVVAQEYEGGIVRFLCDVKQSASAQVKQACNGALWTLKDTLRTSNIQQYKEIGNKLECSIEKEKESEQEDAKFRKKKSGGKSRGRGHVMVSYQWANQQMLKEIRDRIKQHGYKVWMDIDEMGGSTLQAMAEAVENAEVVLMCMSAKYKHSPNCRAEAEYAFQKGKRIIPLKMEKGYVPDGWLGFICGAKLFYDFSGKYPFEDKMGGLLKEMDKVLQASNDRDPGHTDHTTTPVISTVVPVVHAEPPRRNDTPDGVSMTTVAKVPVSMATIQAVRKWSPDDLNQWRNKNNLASSVPKLKSGEEVALLLTMRVESPDFFYRCVQDMLNVKDISVMARLVWALHDITHTGT